MAAHGAAASSSFPFLAAAAATGRPSLPAAALIAVYAGMRLWGVGGMILAPILLLMGRSLVSCGALDGLLRDWKAIRADLGRLWRDSFTKDS